MGQLTNIAACAVISKNFLAHLRVLSASLREHHPGIPIFALLVDRLDGRFDPGREPFELIHYDDLDNIEHPRELLLKYTQLELNTAVKPFFFEYLLRTRGLSKLAFFDADILILHPLDDLWALLDRHSMVLTPHITEPVADGCKPGELDILISGVFNLGFIAMANVPPTRDFLRWWRERLYDECVMAHDRGIHVDQKWVEFAPLFFDDVHILRDPTYNIAYWNLAHRAARMKIENDRVTLDGEPVRFFHFSGFDPDHIEPISYHQDRYTLEDLPHLAPLFRHYRGLLLAQDAAAILKWPYAFDAFDDGTPVAPLVRDVYREMGPQRHPFGDPLGVGPGSFFAWLNAPADGNHEARPVITNIVREVYVRRPDLQQAFPYPMGRDRSALARWMIDDGIHTYRLGRPFAEALHFARPVELAEEPPSASWPPPPLAIGEPLTWRRSMLRLLAHMGAGRIARRVLGPALTTRIRDRLRWGRHAARQFPPPLPAGAGGRQRVLHTEGAFGVNVVGYLCSESGLGEAGRSIARAAEAADLPAAGLSMDFYTGHRKLDSSCPDLAPGNPNRFNVFCVSVDAVLQTLDRLGAAFYAHKYNIASWFWELQDLPREWLAALDYLDEVWAPSSFVQDALAPLAAIPVVRMPVGVEVTAIEPPPVEVLDLPSDRFVFLYVFDYHSYAERKHPLGAVRAFNLAFSERDDVHLVLKGTDSRRNPAYHERLLKLIRPEQMTIIDCYLDRPMVNGLLQRCDCYVSLHRSEGFGFTPAEAMYLGKPVIATAYGGNTDFMRPDNSYLVPYRLVEIDRDYGPYRQGWHWADPDLEAAARMMREVYDNRDEAARRAAAGQRLIREAYSHAAVGRRMRERLELLTGA